MKTRSSLILFVIALGATVTAYAQDEPAIKILPTTDKEVVKVLYAYGNNNESVQIKFFNEDGLSTSDTIEKHTFDNGFTKKYDIHKVRTKSFWIEVSDAMMTVTYKMIETKDKKTYLPYLEKTVYNHPLVAFNN